tara:strand:- start:209 stop:592 length:384 start_codon:yes stop_codon:yes gene_type:complete
MPIQIKGVGKPKGGGGGMDIATKRDALADKMSKAMTSAMKGPRGLSDSDVARALSAARGVIGGRTTSDKTGGRTTSNKAGGGKAKKMMAKGGTAGGKKKMMGGGKAKKMMRGGGKTKKYMARGGKAR